MNSIVFLAIVVVYSSYFVVVPQLLNVIYLCCCNVTTVLLVRGHTGHKMLAQIGIIFCNSKRWVILLCRAGHKGQLSRQSTTV